MIEFIKFLPSFSLGLLMVGGLLAFIYKRRAQAWQTLQPFYGANWEGAAAKRHMQDLLLYSEGDFARPYRGIVTIGVFPNGIGIRFMPILGAFHDPIFVPYKDIEGWQQKWYINAKSVELSFDKKSNLRIIMPKSQIDWIAAQGFANIDISPEAPPTGNWPYATYFSAILSLVLVLGVLLGAFLKADNTNGMFGYIFGSTDLSVDIGTERLDSDLVKTRPIPKFGQALLPS